MSAIGSNASASQDWGALLLLRRGQPLQVFTPADEKPVACAVQAQDEVSNPSASRRRAALRAGIERLGVAPGALAGGLLSELREGLLDGRLDLRDASETVASGELVLRSIAVRARAHGGTPRGTMEVFALELDATTCVPGALSDGAWRTPSDLLAGWRRGDSLLYEAVRYGLAALAGEVLDERGWFSWYGGLRWLPLVSPTLPPATHTNCYLVGERELTVVDPGATGRSTVKPLLAAIDELERGGRKVARCVLTHRHRDHSLQAHVLAARGVPVWAHQAMPELPGIRIEGRFSDGQVIGEGAGALEVLHTPGHVPEHCALRHLASGAVICGDLVAAVGTIVVNPPDGDMVDYMASLRRVRGLAAAMLFPAHGPPIEDPLDHLDAYLEHRLGRERQIVAALEGGASALRAIVEVVYSDVPPSVWPLAERNVLAHLHGLEREGRVYKRRDRYELTVRTEPSR